MLKRGRIRFTTVYGRVKNGELIGRGVNVVSFGLKNCEGKEGWFLFNEGWEVISYLDTGDYGEEAGSQKVS